MRYEETETDYNLGRHLVSLMQDVPFFAEISRNIKKVPTRSKYIKTAAISYDTNNDEIVMWWNPDFFESLSDSEVRGVLTHEFCHFVLGHLTTRRGNPEDNMSWNYAHDLAINSLIIHKSNVRHTESNRLLPGFALVPGQWPTKFDGTPLTPDEMAADKLGQLIASLPTLKASEWYHEQIKDYFQKSGGSGGSGDSHGRGTLDNHDTWNDIPEDMREYVEAVAKSVIEKAVKYADQRTDGWGNIPVEIREEIRRYISKEINWKLLLKQFVGNLYRGNRTTSIKRINKRYPYIYPGTKKGYQAKLLIAVDESGSVVDQWLEKFFGELGNLTRTMSIYVLPFDSHCSEEDLFEWKRGQSIKAKRVKRGGTNFDAPTRFVNDPKNRGRWDGFLIMTDGQAPKPEHSRIKRGWVLPKGCKLIFDTDELQIRLKEDL